MHLALQIIIYTLLFLLIVFAMIIFIPIVYSVEGEKEEYYFLIIRIGLLFSLINLIVHKEENKKKEFSLKIFGFQINLRDDKKAQKLKKKGDIKKEERKRKKAKQENSRSIIFFLKPFLNESFRLARRVLRHIMPKEYRINLIYGFEDPADTGILTGFFYLLFPNVSFSEMIKIQPVFDEEIIQGRINIKGRVIVVILMYYFIQYYFACGVRQTIKKIRNK